MLVIDRFEQKLKQGPDGCIIWTGCINPQGYGMFGDKRKLHSSHRWIWQYFNGSMAERLQIDHLCRTRSCVNIDHLELVSQKENIRRGLKGVLTTTCKFGHLFT